MMYLNSPKKVRLHCVAQQGFQRPAGPSRYLKYYYYDIKGIDAGY